MSQNIQKVLILVAMAEEAEAMIAKLQLKKQEIFFGNKPPQAFRAQLGSLDLWLVINGRAQFEQDGRAFDISLIGTTPATFAATLAIEKIKPDLILNVGTCGGYKKRGAKIADVYVTHTIKFHDRRVPPVGALLGISHYVRGIFPVFYAESLAKSLGFKSGVLSTSDGFDMSDRDHEVLEENQTNIKDMEGAALAWVAHLYQTPLIALKSVTDIVDSDTQTNEEEFLENLQSASESLHQAVVDSLKFIEGKTVEELGSY